MMGVVFCRDPAKMGGAIAIVQVSFCRFGRTQRPVSRNIRDDAADTSMEKQERHIHQYHKKLT